MTLREGGASLKGERGGGASKEDKTDFGQSRFGHPDLTIFGFWPIHFCNLFLANLFLTSFSGGRVGPEVVTPRKRGPER